MFVLLNARSCHVHFKCGIFLKYVLIILKFFYDCFKNNGINMKIIKIKIVHMNLIFKIRNIENKLKIFSNFKHIFVLKNIIKLLSKTVFEK